MLKSEQQHESRAAATDRVQSLSTDSQPAVRLSALIRLEREASTHHPDCDSDRPIISNLSNQSYHLTTEDLTVNQTGPGSVHRELLPGWTSSRKLQNVLFNRDDVISCWCPFTGPEAQTGRCWKCTRTDQIYWPQTVYLKSDSDHFSQETGN